MFSFSEVLFISSEGTLIAIVSYDYPNTMMTLVTLITMMTSSSKNCKNCECCPHHSLFKGHNVMVYIVVFNCQEVYQFLKCQVSGQKSPGSKTFPKFGKIFEDLNFFSPKPEFFLNIGKFTLKFKEFTLNLRDFYP